MGHQVMGEAGDVDHEDQVEEQLQPGGGTLLFRGSQRVSHCYEPTARGRRLTSADLQFAQGAQLMAAALIGLLPVALRHRSLFPSPDCRPW